MHKRHTFHILIALMVFGVTGCTEDEQFLEDNISVDVEEQPANSDAPLQEASNLAPNDHLVSHGGLERCRTTSQSQLR